MQYAIDTGNTSFGISAILYKKTTKLQDKEWVLTHYQRACKNDILITTCGPVESSYLVKTNVYPGTGRGKF